VKGSVRVLTHVSFLALPPTHITPCRAHAQNARHSRTFPYFRSGTAISEREKQKEEDGAAHEHESTNCALESGTVPDYRGEGFWTLHTKVRTPPMKSNKSSITNLLPLNRCRTPVYEQWHCRTCVEDVLLCCLFVCLFALSVCLSHSVASQTKGCAFVCVVPRLPVGLHSWLDR